MVTGLNGDAVLLSAVHMRTRAWYMTDGSSSLSAWCVVFPLHQQPALEISGCGAADGRQQQYCARSDKQTPIEEGTTHMNTVENTMDLLPHQLSTCSSYIGYSSCRAQHKVVAHDPFSTTTGGWGWIPVWLKYVLLAYGHGLSKELGVWGVHGIGGGTTKWSYMYTPTTRPPAIRNKLMTPATDHAVLRRDLRRDW